jgi:hypothetical protein
MAYAQIKIRVLWGAFGSFWTHFPFGQKARARRAPNLLAVLIAACAMSGKQTMGGASGRLGGLVGASARRQKAAAQVVQVRVAQPTLGKAAEVPDNALAVMAKAFEDAARAAKLEQQNVVLQAQILALQAQLTARNGASTSTAPSNTRSITALMEPPIVQMELLAIMKGTDNLVPSPFHAQLLKAGDGVYLGQTATGWVNNSLKLSFANLQIDASTLMMGRCLLD